jgi:hypothetical protein
VAATVQQEPGVQVEVIDGARGEFTVLVDGQTVPQQGDSRPSAEEVLAVVRKTPAGSGR